MTIGLPEHECFSKLVSTSVGGAGVTGFVGAGVTGFDGSSGFVGAGVTGLVGGATGQTMVPHGFTGQPLSSFLGSGIREHPGRNCVQRGIGQALIGLTGTGTGGAGFDGGGSGEAGGVSQGRGPATGGRRGAARNEATTESGFGSRGAGGDELPA